MNCEHQSKSGSDNSILICEIHSKNGSENNFNQLMM